MHEQQILNTLNHLHEMSHAIATAVAALDDKVDTVMRVLAGQEASAIKRLTESTKKAVDELKAVVAKNPLPV